MCPNLKSAYQNFFFIVCKLFFVRIWIKWLVYLFKTLFLCYGTIPLFTCDIVQSLTVSCTVEIANKFWQYLSYAESCLKTHTRHPVQCSAAEDRRSWWLWRWWWSLVQDCFAGPPLCIPLPAVVRGTMLTPFQHDRRLNIKGFRNLLVSASRFSLARLHSFFFSPEIYSRV